eukprot:TRINITY_DN85_c4_g1_i1.p1 TRINITY_DN85_c4_g1~~TRINITY_DN85_c4_g1_i1.p1  ORF type:complete len:506 (+),score=109.40 TRINITY_DN85_c4_g1_i1:49-1566(+)
MSAGLSGWKKLVDSCIELRRTVDFKQLSKVDFSKKKTISVVGTEETLKSIAGSTALPEHVRDTFKALLPRVQKDKVRKQALLGEGVEELIVGQVPTNFTRAMSPYRSDKVFKFVKANFEVKEDAILILAVPSSTHCWSWGVGASRGHSLCSFKGLNPGFDPTVSQTEVTFWSPDEIPDQLFGNLNIIAESIQLTARLVDTPTNYLNTESYAQLVSGLADKLKLKCKLIKGEELKEEGMEMLYSVGRAAEYKSCLAVLSYEPEGADKDDVSCWVGKGIVYDTGGLSLKSTTGMCGMKHDMGGSAGILGGFLATVRLGYKQNLHCLLALADNAVSSESFRNDDIFRCLSGKTIEINNTDAEGRLVLCDAVAYARKQFNPKTIVDMATLTGASGVATGKNFAAIVSNTDELESKAISAGKASGDQCFPVLWAPEYHKPLFESKFADMKNSVSDRTDAQVSSAGYFIFAMALDEEWEGHWLHVDMAYPATNDGKGTGWGVALLVKLAGM